MKTTLVLAMLFLALSQMFASEIFVAPNGRDTNPGTKGKPFATLEAARDAIRSLNKKGDIPAGGVTVWIRGGDYQRLTTFQLTTEDSGTKESPVIYRAWPGEKVRLLGGTAVKGFEPVTDPQALARIPEEARGKVFKADLKARGITDFGKLGRRGFAMGGLPAHMELFFNGKPMTLARWPNDGWAKIAGAPAGPQGGKFTYDGDRPQRWATADDIWVHGYWTWDWADTYEKVKAIDTQAKEIATEPPHGVYGYKAGARYYALNILEELDQPGEYYVDRKTGILYFWLPEPVDKGEALVSLLEGPMVEMQSAEHVTIRGLTFECTRGVGILIQGGSDLLVAGCTLRNVGNTAVSMNGAVKSGIISCDISYTGDSGISISSGDRLSLTPGECEVTNNHIHNFSRWAKTYHPAISVQGMGIRIAHNLMHDAPHSAIIFGGNEHVMEYNEIHHVCMETSDAGGIYAGRDFSWRRNVIRYNYIHDMGTADVRSIYLDDDMSDVHVYGNVLYKGKMGVCIGGGRSNVVENNVFVDCNPSMHVDNRGENWAKPTVDGYMKERLEAMNYRQSPWKDRYPELLTLYDDEPGKPKYNVIERNISFGGKWLNIYSQDYDKTNSIKDNLVDVDPGFVDGAGLDFRLRDDSPAYKMGFRRIPIEEIGLVKDEYRTELPPKESWPMIKKLGTVDLDLVEATPIVFKGKLYRYEYVRPGYKPNTTGDSYFRFIDVATGEATPAFAKGYHLGSAHVQGDTVYVYGVNIWDGAEIKAFWSKDLRNWQSKVALDLPGWGIFNNSVCKGDGRCVMAFEIGRPPEETGVPFTIRFAESPDLLNWKLTPSECVFSKDRYTACPALRFVGGWYYMIYLEAKPGPEYEPYIVRSKDLIHWETSPRNPVMRHSWEDKLIANPKLTPEQREQIEKAVNINNSDVDLCEFQGKTVITYSWGNQQGIEFLAEAVYEGKLADFLREFFPE